MKKRILALILCVMLVFSAAACGGKNEEGSNGTGEYIIDGSGAQLEIQKNREELTIASVYAVTVPFLQALKLTDRVVAVNCKTSFIKHSDEYLEKAGTVGRGVVDMEALAKYAPDVLVHRSNDDDTLEAVTAIGVTLFCIKAESMEDVYNTLEILGKYFGAEDRAKEVIAWMDAKFDMIDSIVATIPEEERVTALLMGGELGRIASGDMLQSWMIEKAGGICTASGIENNFSWTNIGVESVFAMDPEFIFCTSSTALDYTPEEILSDPAWSAVKAVKDENIYIVPAKLDSWDMPGISAALGTMWMLHMMYPDYFSLDQLKAEIDDYYTFLFEQTYDEETLGYTLQY